jgi:hypothetical protein
MSGEDDPLSVPDPAKLKGDKVESSGYNQVANGHWVSVEA